MGIGKFTMRYRQIYEYITGASTNACAGESTNPDLGTMKPYTHLDIG